MPTRDQLVEQDARDLARLGYAQQLFREMGGFSNFAISFSIISVLTGAVLLYAAAYSVVTSISTVTLYLAYVIPIWLNWRNPRRRTGEYATRATAPWSLGRFGPAINAVAILWVIVISVVFALPPNELVLWTMFLLGGLIALYWTLSARRRFAGPAAGQGP